MKMLPRLLAAFALLCAPLSVPTIAHAQAAQPLSACGGIVYTANGEPRPLTQTTGGLLCTNAAGGSGASSGGIGANPFTATSANNGIALSVTSTTGRVALTSGVTLKICNTGSKTAYVTTGNSSVTATTAGIPIPAAACDYVASSAAADVAGITGGSDTTSLVIIPGSTVADGAPTLGSASGGLSVKKLVALTNGAVAIDAAAGQLYMLQCGNPNASQEYLQLWDVAQGSVTVGTTPPTYTIECAATNICGFALSLVGIQHTTAITIAATTTATGGSAPGTALDCVAGYK